MAQIRVKLIYPTGQVTEPIIAELALRFSVRANIRRASVEDGTGWLVCELDGEPSALKSGISWLQETGIEIESLGDVVES